jgi:hypothetical protein
MLRDKPRRVNYVVIEFSETKKKDGLTIPLIVAFKIEIVMFSFETTHFCVSVLMRYEGEVHSYLV